MFICLYLIFTKRTHSLTARRTQLANVLLFRTLCESGSAGIRSVGNDGLVSERHSLYMCYLQLLHQRSDSDRVDPVGFIPPLVCIFA